MASLHEARPTTSTSTGTPAAVRAVPHRVAGTLLAVGPEPPPAAVVLCFPGVAPQPATTPAASSTKALAATARERPRMGPPFPRNHHALYQRALPSRRPSHAKPVTPVDDRVAYLAHPMHNFSEKSGPCPDSDQVLGENSWASGWRWRAPAATRAGNFCASLAATRIWSSGPSPPRRAPGHPSRWPIRTWPTWTPTPSSRSTRP